MIFGKIDYLNLLPFHIFLKKYIKSSHLKSIIRHKKNVPSSINKEFKKRRVDGAFISSVESKNKKCLDVGIVARGEVKSVLVRPGKIGFDTASATSNKLAQILKINGEVIIGDRALKYFLSGEPCVDLGKQWKINTNLPFVFARFCYNKHGKYLKKLGNEFINKKHKIPHYILNKESKKIGISNNEILSYLTLISYKIDKKANKGLNLFLKKANKISK